MSHLAGGPIGAEACEVVRAHGAEDMTLWALGALAAESSLVGGAQRDFRLWIHMSERAVRVLSTEPSFSVRSALWQLPLVELVQKLTLVAFLAQSSEPVPANDLVRVRRQNVPVGAQPPSLARRAGVVPAYGLFRTYVISVICV